MILDLDICERLGELVHAHSHAPDAESYKPSCRVCGASVYRPRFRYCSAACFAVIYGRASERSLAMRVDRELVLARETAAAHVLRTEPSEVTALDDGEPRVPTALAARIAPLEAWSDRLARRAS